MTSSAPTPLYVRVRQDGTGRLRVKELYLDASANDDVPITGNDLRQLSLSRVEALINAHSNAVLHRVRRVGPDLSTLATYYVTSFGNYERQIKERNWVVLWVPNSSSTAVTSSVARWWLSGVIIDRGAVTTVSERSAAGRAWLGLVTRVRGRQISKPLDEEKR
jgi:hypothetical protein